MRALLFSYHCDQQPLAAEGEKRMVSAFCIVCYFTTAESACQPQFRRFSLIFAGNFLAREKFRRRFPDRLPATEKPSSPEGNEGCVHSVKSNAPQRLLLEYNAGGCAGGCIIEWGDFEAEVFSYETNWYIGTIARENWCSIHGLFFTVQGVGVFTDGHYEFGVAYSVGYALSVLIPFNFSAKCFAEYAEWNHGSPSIVYIWSAVAFNNGTVDEVIAGADGHNNIAACVFVNFTKGVGKSSAVHFAIVSNNNYAYISSAFCIAVQSQGAFAVLNFVVLNVSFYVSISVALIFYISVELTINLGNVTFFVNNGYGNLVVFVNNAGGWVEGQGFTKIVLNNGEFLFNILAVFFIKYLYGNGGTNKGVVGRFVVKSIEVEVATNPGVTIVNNSIAVYTGLEVIVISFYFNAISINIERNNFYRLTKSNLAVDFSDSIIAGFNPTSWACIHIENDVFYSTKLSKVKGSGSCLVAALECDLHSVFARNQVSSSASVVFIGVNKSVNALSFVPNEAEIISFKLGAIWLGNTQAVHVGEISVASYFIAVNVSQSELNCFCKVTGSTNIRVCIFCIVTGEEITTIFYSLDVANIELVGNNSQSGGGIAVNFFYINIKFAIVVNGEGEFKFTTSVGGYSAFIREAAEGNATLSSNFQDFALSANIIFVYSLTSYSVNFYTIWSNIIGDSVGIVAFTIWAAYSSILSWLFKSDLSSFHCFFGNVNSYCGQIIIGCRNFFIRDLWNTNFSGSIKSITITSSCEGCSQCSLVLNRTSYFPQTLSTFFCNRIGFGVYSCKGNISNNFALAVFCPNINSFATVSKFHCAFTIVSGANVEFEFLSFVLCNRNSCVITIDQKTAVTSNCVGSVNGNSCNFLNRSHIAEALARNPCACIQIICTRFSKGNCHRFRITAIS